MSSVSSVTIVSACDLSSSVCCTIVPHFLHDLANSILPANPLPILAHNDQAIEILVLHIAFEETPRIMSAATGAPYFPGVRHLSHICAGGFRLSPVHYHHWGHARDLCNSLRSCSCAILNIDRDEALHHSKSNTYLEKPLGADALDLHVMIVEAVAPEAAPGLGVVGVADPVTVRAGVGEAGTGAAVEAADPLQVEAAHSLVLIDAVTPGLPDHIVTVLDILLVSCTFQLLYNW